MPVPPPTHIYRLNIHALFPALEFSVKSDAHRLRSRFTVFYMGCGNFFYTPQCGFREFSSDPRHREAGGRPELGAPARASRLVFKASRLGERPNALRLGSLSFLERMQAYRRCRRAANAIGTRGDRHECPAATTPSSPKSPPTGLVRASRKKALEQDHADAVNTDGCFLRTY